MEAACLVNRNPTMLLALYVAYKLEKQINLQMEVEEEKKN